MRVLDVFTAACAILSQTVEDSEELAVLTPAWLGVLMRECLPNENMLRRQEGKEELTALPLVASGTDTAPLPFHEEIAGTAMVYGLAAFFFLDDENTYMHNYYRSLYVQALGEMTRAEDGVVEDLY